MNIRKIEAHKPIEQKKLRVAAYCRVSTDIVVYGRDCIEFKLKCGLTLKEAI